MQFCSVEKCSYPNFAIDKVTRLPYCRMHQTKRTDFDRRSIIHKAMDKQKSVSTKIRSLQNTPPNKELLIQNGKVKDENKLMLDLWYLARKYEMTGKCSEKGCCNSTNKGHDKYFRWSCCHIVPKSLVPSVATHFANCIELCQIHHQEYDAGFERAKRMKCFKIAKATFDTFKHLIPDNEMKWVNPYLIND